MKLKALTEKRAELVEKMNSLVNQADTENRAMSEEEAAAFDAAEKEIKDLDATIARGARFLPSFGMPRGAGRGCA